MPAFTLSASYPLAISTVEIGGVDVPSISAGARGSQLRRPGSDPFQHGREYSLVPHGVITLEPVAMSGLQELFGVDLDVTWSLADLDPKEACGLQVSVDNGETFLAWTGAAWEEQAENEIFNSLAVCNDHLSTLVLTNPRGISFRVKLIAVRDVSPIVRGVVAYVEWRYEPQIDFYEMISARMAAARFPYQVRKRLAANTATISMSGHPMTLDATKPVRVFNVTADAAQNTDLFSEVDGNNIVLTAVQNSGAEILIEAYGTMPIILVRQDEMLRKTSVPALEVHVGKWREASSDVGRQYDYRRGDVSRRVRVRQRASTRSIPVRLDVVTAEPRTALMAPDALRAALSDVTLRSPASGQIVTVIEEVPGEELTVLAEGVEVGRWNGKFFVSFPSFPYEEFEATRDTEVAIGGSRRTWERRNL